jgi:hypothetical protein
VKEEERKRKNKMKVEVNRVQYIQKGQKVYTKRCVGVNITVLPRWGRYDCQEDRRQGT